jgi:phosphoesterase RecJ-like protein
MLLKHMKIDYRHTVEIVSGWNPETLRELLGNARRVVLTAHTNADGDAVGSLTAMYTLLTNALTHSHTNALSITPMLPDGCPDDLRWLPNTDKILGGKDDFDRCREAIADADLMIGMDISGLDRTGSLAPLLKASQAPRILFDHHIGPDRDNFAVVVSDPEISSTCELIYWAFLVTYGATAFDKDSATSLFTGMCTDTGTFSYTNRQPSLYLAASSLLAYGIDPMEINQQIKNVFTEQRLRFFGHAQSELLTVYPERQTALMVIRQEEMEHYGVESADLTGLVNEVMRLHDVDCAILIREEKDRVRLSLRSKNHTDVNRLASELFDGGGHERAAGATSTLSLADTVQRVKKHLGLLALTLIACLTMASCHDVPVIDVQAPKGDTLRENMINANRHIANSEKTQIDAYISRRGWQMKTLDDGIRLMETRHGNGPAIGYDDTIVLKYSIEAINGTVIYPSLTDTVVTGRHQPTPGIDLALRTLTVGSQACVIVPSEQAYGVVGDGDRIPSRLILVCKIEKILKINE